MNATPLLDPEGLEQVQRALVQQDLTGWLLYEFRHQNPVSASLLGVGHTTRRAFVLIPASGSPTALIHAIESAAWRHWPWERASYAGWEEMEGRLSSLLEGQDRVAMEVSHRSGVPTLDLAPSGVVDLVRECSVDIRSSGDLVTRFYSVWTQQQLRRHRETAEVLKEVARSAFRKAADAVRAGHPTTEASLSQWILDELATRGISAGRDCHVAVGAMAADPHYAPSGAGELIGPDQVLLIDLWGKVDEDDVWADQTWMGYLGSTVPADVVEVWDTVRAARDAAIDFLWERHRAGQPVKGLEVDDVARRVISDAGFGDRFIHRTGHSMDRGLHGSGPNLDNLETRDDRVLIEGVGFSVEPGIYLPGRFGIRSEVNVHLGAGGPEVTPAAPQTEVFPLLHD